MSTLWDPCPKFYQYVRTGPNARYGGKFCYLKRCQFLDVPLYCARTFVGESNRTGLNQLEPILLRFWVESVLYYINSDVRNIFFDLERQRIVDPLPGHAGDAVDARLPGHPAHRPRPKLRTSCLS
jgi:hypothetical protein